MKKLLMSVVVLAGLNSFAGPEDHMMSQTCYYLKNPSQIALATQYVPTQICIETVNIDTDKNTITAFSYFMPELYQNLNLNYLVRKNEDSFSFKAVNNLATEAEIGISETVTSDLLMSGVVDNQGYADVRYLSIQVKQTKEKYKSVGHTITDATVFDYVAQ